MKIEQIDNQIKKLEEDNKKKLEIIDKNNKKIDELTKRKKELEMTEFITVISKKGLDLQTLKEKIMNNEIATATKKEGENCE